MRDRGGVLNRFLPGGFLEAYARLAGRRPAPALRDFLEAYELLQDVLYHGSGIREDAGKVTGGGDHEGYWFGDDSLLELKAEVDLRLARLGSNIRLWSEARSRQGSDRSGPPGHDRGDLARAGGAWHDGPLGDDT